MKPLLDVIQRAPNVAQDDVAQDLGFFDRSVPCIDAEGPPPSSVGRKLSFGPRSVIFLEGDEARSIFQVIDGAVMLYKLLPDGRRQVVEVLGAGDVFGCSLPAVRDCSAETLLATRCLAVGREFVEGSPALVQWLNLRLRAQLCALHEHVTLLGRKSAMERLTSFLMRSIPGRGRIGCAGPRNGDDHADIRLTLMRQEIADYLGLTIETVSRLLTKLKRRKIMSIARLDEIHIHDVCRLCRLTGTHLTRGEWCSSHMQGRSRASLC
jgi:CRP-like cAMP-binding protein